MEQVVVGDYALLQKKKSAIQLAGPAKLQVSHYIFFCIF